MDQESFIILCPHCGAKNRIPLRRISSRARCGRCHESLVSSPGSEQQAHTVNVNDINFQQEVIRNPGPVLVDFWAPWCGHCRNMEPVLEQLAGEYSGRLKIAKLNVEESQRVASEYDIRSVPNLLFFRNGKVVDSVAGAVPKTELMRHIQSVL